MDIKVDEVENLLWDNGIEYELLSDGSTTKIKIMGLSRVIFLLPAWPNEDGELVLDSDDLNLYTDDEFFGQLSGETPEEVVEELDSILENFR